MQIRAAQPERLTDRNPENHNNTNKTDHANDAQPQATLPLLLLGHPRRTAASCAQPMPGLTR